MHPCSCSPDEIYPLFRHLVYTHRKWSESRGSTRGFCTSGRWSKSCRALTSGELLQSSELTDRPFLFHKSKRQPPFLDCLQDAGVPHQALGPPRHVKHPDQHARAEPGSGLGSKPATASPSHSRSRLLKLCMLTLEFLFFFCLQM